MYGHNSIENGFYNERSLSSLGDADDVMAPRPLLEESIDIDEEAVKHCLDKCRPVAA